MYFKRTNFARCPIYKGQEVFRGVNCHPTYRAAAALLSTVVEALQACAAYMINMYLN